MKGHLVINADDLGMSPEVNAGILYGFQHGFVSDTSLLVKAPFAESAVEGLMNLDIRQAGIHINLDERLGWAPGGWELHPRAVLMERLRGTEMIGACAREAREQIELFLSFNLIPTHLDTHHHVHGMVPIFEMLINLMDEYAIPAMRYSALGYRLPTREDIPYDPGTYLRMGNTLREKGMLFCDDYLEGARKIAEVKSGVTELVVHPSYGGEPWRSVELEYLQSEYGVANLKNKGISLTSFSGLINGDHLNDGSSGLNIPG